jgi:two-component system response regulator AtoC
VRIQAYPLRTNSGEIYAGVLIQKDAVRHHPDADAELCPGARMIGASPAFRKARGQIKLAAGSDAPVLLQGETGTGKELAAAYTHHHSARRDGHFHTLDCTALTEELFENEVFGHERGAFTGSVGEKRGLFELADKGTLFLDEIGELSLTVQAKLLRVLESGEFRRVGGVKTRSANVRIVCATNRQLRDASWFRSDLYFRVACITVHLPNLVERRSDIPALADELLKRIGQSSGQQFTLDDDAQRLLQDYDYPGNIRELRNILWVAAVNSPSGRISGQQVATALPTRINGSCHASRGTEHGRITHRETVSPSAGFEMHQRPPPRHAWEADHLAMVLRRHNGNRRAVAEELGVSERTVYRKLKQFGLN